jgi:hypothetical protein
LGDAVKKGYKALATQLRAVGTPTRQHNVNVKKAAAKKAQPSAKKSAAKKTAKASKSTATKKAAKKS